MPDLQHVNRRLDVRSANLASFGITISEVLVDIVGTEAVRPPDPNGREFPCLDESIHRHGGYSHQLCHFCDCHEVSTFVELAHVVGPFSACELEPIRL